MKHYLGGPAEWGVPRGCTWSYISQLYCLQSITWIALQPIAFYESTLYFAPASLGDVFTLAIDGTFNSFYGWKVRAAWSWAPVLWASKNLESRWIIGVVNLLIAMKIWEQIFPWVVMMLIIQKFAFESFKKQLKKKLHFSISVQPACNVIRN